MDRGSPYCRQVQLLVRCLPIVAQEECFALKGGTAINLFVRNFPRLSVDIDLSYLPLEEREAALRNVREALDRIALRIEEELGFAAKSQENKGDEMRLIVRGDGAQIKVEVSPVSRGTYLEPKVMDVVEEVEDEFGFAQIRVLDLPDLYGGKICAALDRQHPRDLYDVMMLLDGGGIDRSIFEGFLVYLLSHNRPISEVMNPRWKDISEVYEKEFVGMTKDGISLEALNEVPARLMAALSEQFTQQDADFLMSFKSGKPDWSLAPSPDIQNLPAIRWKQRNIGRMSQEKHAQSMLALQQVVDDWLSAK